MSDHHSHATRERYRRDLYETMADDGLSVAEKRERALDIGRAALGVENGHVERFDGDTHAIVASVGAEDLITTGARVDHATTYCRRTVEADSPLALSNASEEGWADDPAYREHGLECYLGTPIFVDGETYGTVCFVDRDPRAEAFAPEERAFVELIARLLGRELETRSHERALAEREERLDEREQALERSEAKYESLVTTAPDAIVLADVETGTIVEANEAAGDLIGTDRDELIGMHQPEMHPPDGRERYRETFREFVEEEGTRSEFADGTPLLVRRVDGTDVPVEISASVVELDGREYVQGIVRDISGRRDRERELRLKNRAIDEAGVGITIADATAPDLPLTYANDAFERVTGYAVEEALGRNCRFLQGPGTDTEAIAELRDAIHACEPITTELRNYRADGTPFWNELTLTPVADGTGAVTHFVGFQRDVTARKRRQRLITVLNRVLRHNLRNDMQAVIGYAELIGEEATGRPAELAERIETTARELTSLSETARELETSAEAVETPARRDVAPIVSEVAAGVRERHPDADIRVDAPEPAPAITPGRLSTAIRELVENAVTHGGGTVAVGVTSTGEGDVEISVGDDGSGLPEQEQAVLHRGYETPLEHGSGLGLWLVNWIVTAVGGRVAATADDGVTVTLPGDSAGARDQQAAIGTE